MMELSTNFLSIDEIKKIHRESIKILEGIGVKFCSKKALELLEENGAKIDWDKQVAYINEDMVNKALDNAPSTFTLGARNPEFDFQMPSSFSGYTLDGCGVNIQDFKTGKRREGVTKDIIDSLRVFEEMDLGTIVWPPIVANDMPINSAEVRAFLISLMTTSKHVQNELHHPKEVPYLIEALRAILGSDEKIKERKIVSVTYCPVAPLVHDEQMLDAYIELTKYHIPILTYPMPACGTTGPASLYSNIALANAEGLSCLVIFQAANPGTPIIYGDASGTINFSSGTFLEGAPEMVLQTGAICDIARYYNLPNTAAGCLSDSKISNAQAVLEKMITTLPLVLSGVDVVQGMGLVEGSMLLSLEQIVVDNEIAHLCKRLKDGIQVSKDKDYFEDILRVGPGGHFLKRKNTRKASRSNEFYIPELIDRNTYDTWLELGRPDLYSNARKRVEKILNSEQRCPLQTDTQKVLNEIMEKADGDL